MFGDEIARCPGTDRAVTSVSMIDRRPGGQVRLELADTAELSVVADGILDRTP